MRSIGAKVEGEPAEAGAATGADGAAVATGNDAAPAVDLENPNPIGPSLRYSKRLALSKGEQDDIVVSRRGSLRDWTSEDHLLRETVTYFDMWTEAQ